MFYCQPLDFDWFFVDFDCFCCFDWFSLLWLDGAARIPEIKSLAWSPRDENESKQQKQSKSMKNQSKLKMYCKNIGKHSKKQLFC